MCTNIRLVSNKQFLLAVDYASLLGARKYKASHGDINISTELSLYRCCCC